MRQIPEGDLMQIYVRIIVIFLVVITFFGAVSAFSISSATYTIDEDGDGSVVLEYQLNGTEKQQYDLITRLLDLKSIAKEEVKRSLNREITVTSITPESVKLLVDEMAEMNETTVSTSSFTYVPMESLVDPSLFWVIQRFDINFIPHTSTIIFPDGYKETFTDVDTIPNLTHTLTSGN